MTTETKKTIYEKKGHVAYLTINNPAKANVLDSDVIDGMGAGFRDYWEDREMRCLIVTAAGDRHFSAGHFLQPPRQGQSEEERRLAQIESFLYPRGGTIEGARVSVFGGGYEYPRIWKPVVAAVNGWAAGAGLYMMTTTSDIRIACADHAHFYYAFTSNLSSLGGGPSATRLIKQLSYAHAMKFLLMDEPIDAEEAVRIGLINEAVPHDRLMARAQEIADRISSLPPLPVRFLKEFLVRARDLSEDQAYHLQRMYNHLATTHNADAADAQQAFLEKRPKRITGKIRI